MTDAVIIAGTTGMEKSMAHIVINIIECIQDEVACTTIIKNLTGDISIFSFDMGYRVNCLLTGNQTRRQQEKDLLYLPTGRCFSCRLQSGLK